MKFSGKMYFKLILKVTKKQGFTLSLEDTFFEKSQWGQINPLPAILGLEIWLHPWEYTFRRCSVFRQF